MFKAWIILYDFSSLISFFANYTVPHESNLGTTSSLMSADCTATTPSESRAIIKRH